MLVMTTPCTYKLQHNSEQSSHNFSPSTDRERPNNTETMSQQSTNLQVLLLPFMAQGHFIPFLALAKLLENKTNHTISLITTPLNIQNLKSALPPTTTIRLTPLPFNGSDHGLPPFIENTASAPPHLFLPLIQASQSLQPAFDRLVADICRESPSLCIISDAFMSWSVETAKRFGVFHCVFNTMGAFGTSIFMSLWTHFPHRQIHDDEFRLPDLPNVYLHRSQLSDASRAADGSDFWSVFFRKQISFWKETKVMLLNTVEEVEEKALEQLRIKLKRVLAIGPVIPSPPPPSSSWNPLSCINWLNQHPPNSVLYISFGSQNSIHPSQMMELAKGLEASEKPFIWVIKPPIGFYLKDHEFSPKWLPEGFEYRMTERKRGLLVKTWAPQMEILSHGSTGAFLSHCGWNSTLESLSWGVPIIGWPLSSEQFFNSKLVEEELGAGVEVARGSKAEIGGVDVARIIGLVMDEESEKGRKVRKRAKEMMEMMKAATEEGESCKGSSMIAMEEFFEAVACWMRMAGSSSSAEHLLFDWSFGCY